MDTTAPLPLVREPETYMTSLQKVQLGINLKSYQQLLSMLDYQDVFKVHHSQCEN